MELTNAPVMENDMLKKQAVNFCNKYTVRFLSDELQNDGSHLIEYKTIDGMNFADRVSLKFAPDGNTLLFTDCTCYNKKKANTCLHIAAAVLDYTKKNAE